METQQLFKKFNYSIVPTALAGKTVASNSTSSNEASLVNVNIDFEQEDFNLEGDWAVYNVIQQTRRKKLV